MRSYITKGIVLGRTDYGEADRILTFLTNDHGKIKAMARGVRRAKAKLAGSVELFSVSDLTLIPGKKEIDTLISARLVTHYGEIVKDSDRTQQAYDAIKATDKITEQASELVFFEILRTTLQSLDDADVDPRISGIWFQLQLLKATGHSPNLQTDDEGKKLPEANAYTFVTEQMCFNPTPRGRYRADDIKFLRLCLSAGSPKNLGRIGNSEKLAAKLQPLATAMLSQYLRV